MVPPPAHAPLLSWKVSAVKVLLALRHQGSFFGVTVTLPRKLVVHGLPTPLLNSAVSMLPSIEVPLFVVRVPVIFALVHSTVPREVVNLVFPVFLPMIFVPVVTAVLPFVRTGEAEARAGTTAIAAKATSARHAVMSFLC